MQYPKTLLIINAGVEAVAGIELARSMGLHVVVSDMNPDAPGFAVADDQLLASTYDVEATVAAARTYHKQVRPLNGVMCIACDVPMTVASVAAALELPGISIESARLATNKLEMKERFASDGVPIPWFSPVNSAKELCQLVSKQGLPLVIKPVDSCGSRGVLRLTPSVDLEWAYEVAQGHSPSGRVMLEEFLPGPQVSTESLVIDGQVYTPGFADRNYEFLERYSPHIIENGGQLPTHLDMTTQQAVHRLVQHAATSMGIREGVVKGDIVVTDDRPYVIEIAARLSGGYFCTHEIPLSTGVDLVGAAIRQSLGERVDPRELKPKWNRPVAQRYLFPSPGLVRVVEGADRFADHPNVAHLEIRAKPGDRIGLIDSHPARAGVVITTGKTADSAISIAENVIDGIKVVVE